MMVVSGDSPPDPKLDQYYGSRGFGNLDYEGLSARLGPKKIPSLGLTFSWAVFPLLWIRRFICYAGSCLLGSVMVYELQLVSFFFFFFSLFLLLETLVVLLLASCLYRRQPGHLFLPTD